MNNMWKWFQVLSIIIYLIIELTFETDGESNSSGYPLDLVLSSQHQGEETKAFFRLLPQYFDLHENKTRISILFADRRPYIGLNFTYNESIYLKAIDESVQTDTLVEDNDVDAFKIAAKQLFAISSGNSKAMIFIQNGGPGWSGAGNEVIKLRSMNVWFYLICPVIGSLPGRRAIRTPVGRGCAEIAWQADCSFMVSDPGILHGEVFELINQTIEEKFRNSSSTCGNGSGLIFIDSGIGPTANESLVSGSRSGIFLTSVQRTAYDLLSAIAMAFIRLIVFLLKVQM